jgi:hypothetical protein
MSERRLSLKALRLQRGEIEKDLHAFKEAYDAINRRFREAAADESLPSLEHWSGSRAVMGSLELSIRHLEKELADYIQAIQLVENGEIENADGPEKGPYLRLVT